MKRDSGGRSNRTSTGKGGGEEGTSSQSKGEPALGSLIWIRLNGDSWWPAQVVDEEGVSETNKPYGILPGGVLVRLYGSYKYLFVDPVRSLSEFETVLSQNNGSYQDILRRALEQDVPTSKAGRSKGGGSTPKGAAKTRTGASKDATPYRRLSEGIIEVDDTTVREAVVTTAEMKAKRKGRTSKEDGEDGTPGKLAQEGTPEFKLGSVSGRLKLRNRSAAEKAKVRISRQVQVDNKQDGHQEEHLPRLDLSDEDRNGTAQDDDGKKKRRSSSLRADQRLRDQPSEPDRTSKSESKKPKISSAKKEGKSEVPKLADSVKKEKPAPTPLVKPKELSTRRLRVMKNLGLIGPSGSPFQKNGCSLVLD